MFKRILFVALVLVGSVVCASKFTKHYQGYATDTAEARNIFIKKDWYEIEVARHAFPNTFKTISVQGSKVEVVLIIDSSVTQTTVQVKKYTPVGYTIDKMVKISMQGDTLKLQEQNLFMWWEKGRLGSHIKYIIRTPYTLEQKDADIPHVIEDPRRSFKDIKIQAGTVTFACRENINNITVKAGTVTIVAPSVSGHVKIDAGTFKGDIGIAQSCYHRKEIACPKSVVLKTGTAVLTLTIPTDTYVPLDKITVSPAVTVNSQIPTVAVPLQVANHFLEGRLYPLNLTVETGSSQITIVPAKA